jgi:hypothetical protein
MTSEKYNFPFQHTDVPAAPKADDSIPPRPASITIIAYLQLFGLGNLAIYFLLFGRHLRHVALIPDVPISAEVQWQLFTAIWCGCFFIAVGLLWAHRWARLAYVIWGVSGFLLLGFFNWKAQWNFISQLLVGVLLFAVFVYLLYRDDTKAYFRSADMTRPRASKRRQCGRYLYLLAVVFAFWSLNAIVLGITLIYPETVGRDKLAFIALPFILIAEWVGKSPGVLSRLNILAITFAVYLLQTFLGRYFLLHGVRMEPSLLQLRNWSFGFSSVALVLAFLQYRSSRGK